MYYPADFRTPEWVKHAIFYQIFPERFDNGDPHNDPENVHPWGSPPTISNYMGGDLQGIINRLDYLADLGITAIYLNPIFHASSNHKYNTIDYFQIDPHFGDLATFHRLIDRAHRRGIRVILDAVFNHCGRGFFAFTSVLEQGTDSPYRHWFCINGWPINPYDESLPANYECWWDIRSLPKFNAYHHAVRHYLLRVARYWIEQGADGWRLDVPNEIADHNFWREFRRVVKEANPEAYIVGEIWKDAAPWLDGTQFDGVMNYLFRDLCRDFFAHDSIGADQFAGGIEELLHRYPREAVLAQLNLFGSHDTTRFRTEAHGDTRRLYAAYLLLMTFPGAPCIYYGDEVGMEGGQDPDCRRCMNWDGSNWDHQLREWIKRCIAIRRAHPALRTGEYRTLLAWNHQRLYAFARWDQHERLVVVINAHDHAHTLHIPVHDVPIGHELFLHNLLDNSHYLVRHGHIEHVNVPARGGVVLHAVA